MRSVHHHLLDGAWVDGGTERASTPKDLVQIDLMPDTPDGVTTYTWREPGERPYDEYLRDACMSGAHMGI